jgi:hypothetical protein
MPDENTTSRSKLCGSVSIRTRRRCACVARLPNVPSHPQDADGAKHFPTKTLPRVATEIASHVSIAAVDRMMPLIARQPAGSAPIANALIRQDRNSGSGALAIVWRFQDTGVPIRCHGALARDKDDRTGSPSRRHEASSCRTLTMYPAYDRWLSSSLAFLTASSRLRAFMVHVDATPHTELTTSYVMRSGAA